MTKKESIGLARRNARLRFVPITAPIAVGMSETASSQYVFFSTLC